MKTSNITLTSSEKIALISNFATMLSSGIPILETVESLLEDAKGNQKKLLLALKADLAQGNHVWSCFEKFPQIFNKVTVNIIKASEQAGTLDVALKDLKANIQKETEFTDKVRGALIYPLIIICVFVGVMLVILIFVIPKISTVFMRLQVHLPLPTRILIFISNTMLNYSIPLVVGLATFIGLFWLLYKKQKKAIIDAFSSLPLITDLVKQIDLTRFTRSLYLLLNSGIPITTALEYTQEVVTKKEIAKVIRHSHDLVLSGHQLSEGFKENKKIIPSIVIRIMEAGERSGTLDKSMQDISEFMDYQVSTTLRTLTALIEPLMLVFVGVLIGGMMMSIIAPIYNIIGQVGAH